MQFEIAKIAKDVSKQIGKKILTISGGVNARALREHFLSNNFEGTIEGILEKNINSIVSILNLEIESRKSDSRFLLLISSEKESSGDPNIIPDLY